MCYEDDFYYEPSEFDQQVEEFKASLMKSVKEDFLHRMEALEKENAALREFRDQRNTVIRDYAAKVAAAQREARMAEEKWKNARLHQLLGDFLTTGWKVGYNQVMDDKCDKCDADRYIHFLSPQGNECKEKCNCATYTLRYFPKEVSLSRFYVRKKNFYGGDKGESDFYHRYYTVDHRNDDDVYEMAAKVYFHDFDCETADKWHAVFMDEADCKRYCDWLNEQEAKKRGEVAE